MTRRRQEFHADGYSRQHGFTLIELMIAMTIGLVFTLAVTQVLSTSEGHRRSTVGVNDVGQVGTYAMFQLDKLIRSSGSGFEYSHLLSYGCTLDAQLNGKNILPSPTLAVPFDSVMADLGGTIRLAPIVIVDNGSGFKNPGASSDVLITMSGSAGYGEVGSLVSQASTGANLLLANTVGFSAGHLVLVTDQGLPCLISQVDATFKTSQQLGSVITTLPLAGTYYTAAGADVALSQFGNPTAQALDLGDPSSTSNQPLFQVIGVNEADYSLYSYDLLNIASASNLVVADQVFELKARYCIDTTGTDYYSSPNPQPCTWVSPVAGNPAATVDLTDPTTGVVTQTKFDAASLMAAPNLTNALYSIKAVRLGLILRSALKERDPVQAATTLKLFSSLGANLEYDRVLANPPSDEQYFRYRTLEATIPIRNNYY